MKYTNDEYAEVYEVIKRNDDFKDKLPKEVLSHIKSNAKRTRKVFSFDEEDMLKQISKNALSLITYLHLKYVEEETEIREELKRILVKNEMKKV